MLYKMLLIEISSLLSGQRRKKQLLVTQSPLLADNINQYFEELYKSLLDCNPAFLEASNRLGSRSTDLPKKYSELKQCHSPIIVPASQVWSIYECLYQCILTETNDRLKLFSMLEADIRPQGPQRRTLSFEVFMSEYWVHFPRDSIKTLGVYFVL
jgi:hemoglobin-like flavoprotein